MICAQFQFSSIDSYSAFNSGHSHKAASKKSGYGCTFRPLMRRQWQEKNSTWDNMKKPWEERDSKGNLSSSGQHQMVRLWVITLKLAQCHKCSVCTTFSVFISSDRSSLVVTRSSRVIWMIPKEVLRGILCHSKTFSYAKNLLRIRRLHVHVYNLHLKDLFKKKKTTTLFYSKMPLLTDMMNSWNHSLSLFTVLPSLQRQRDSFSLVTPAFIPVSTHFML